MLIKVAEKYLSPGLIRYIQKKSMNNTPRVPNISEHLLQGCQFSNFLSTEKLKNTLEQQNRRIHGIVGGVKDCRTI